MAALEIEAADLAIVENAFDEAPEVETSYGTDETRLELIDSLVVVAWQIVSFW